MKEFKANIKYLLHLFGFGKHDWGAWIGFGHNRIKRYCKLCGKQQVY